jgi:hypothetical protein
MQRSPIIVKLGASLLCKGRVASLQSTFYYGLWNVLRVCLLDLAAGMHEISHLRTTWWWLGDTLGVWNTAAILTQHKHLWSLVSFSLFAPKLTCTSSPIENFDRSEASRFLRPWQRFPPSPSKITHSWVMFRDSLEHLPRCCLSCLRRRLDSETNCYWLSLTFQVSNA